MSILNFDRYFDKAFALPGDMVTVTTNVSFLAPPIPLPGVYFNNIGDNLGGSGSLSGPLNSTFTSAAVFTNLTPATVSRSWVGVSPTTQGCSRARPTAGPYPRPTGGPGDDWEAVAGGVPAGLSYEDTYQVHVNAVIGTVIGVPIRVTPALNGTIAPNTMMIDLGQNMLLNIISGPAPGKHFRRLTIGAQPCFAVDSLIKIKMDEHFLFSPAGELKPGSLLTNSSGEQIPLSYTVRFDRPVYNYIRIRKDALGENCPNRTLNICRGHPILLDGQVVNPEDLLGSAGVDEVRTENEAESKAICTLVTPTRTFVDIQGLFVATWSKEGWENAVRTEPRFASMSWRKVE